MKYLPTLLALAALLLIPAAVAFERLSPEARQNRLAFFPGRDEVSRHTPLHATGTFLLPRFIKDTTLTPDQNPVILTSRTEIAPGITVTLAPSTHLYAHEFAELDVFGTLRMQGSENQPIVFTTNEQHPQNQLWNGIIVKNGGRVEITHAEFHYASPALTCEKGSIGSLTHSEIHEALIGIFTSSSNCIFANNRIQAIQKNIETLKIE